MISIDGRSYNANWIESSLTLTAEILNGPDSGRLQGTYKMYIQYAGTFFNYKGQLRRTNDCSDWEWEDLFNTLANPINDHTITFPFGADSDITQKVYIAKIEKVLKRVEKNSNKWDNIYEVTFVAMDPLWKP